MPEPRKSARSPSRPGGKPTVTKFRREAPPAAPPPEPVRIPVNWFKKVVGVLLLPLCWISTAALFGVFSNPGARDLWHSREVWLFSVGFLAWLLAFFFLPRPTGLYVVGHEHTHAIFVWLCGGRVGRIHSTSEGGYIVSDRNNFLISLSPYIVPFWTLVSLAILWAARLAATKFAIEIPYYNHLLFFCTGIGWSFHITFTVDMIWKGQPDIEENGRFFSLTLIYLCNILLISGMLVMASPRVTLRDLGKRAATEAMAIFRSAEEIAPVR